MNKKKILFLLSFCIIAVIMLISGVISAILSTSKSTVRYVNGENTTIDIIGDSFPTSSENSPSESAQSNNFASSNSLSSIISSTIIKVENRKATVCGYMAPYKIPNNGIALRSGTYRFEIYKTKTGYKTQILNQKNEIVQNQVNPINIQIKKKNSIDDFLGNNSKTEMIAADYSQVSISGSVIIATAQVKSEEGSVFEIFDQYIVGKTKNGFEMFRDIKVKFAAKGDDGFNSIVKFKEASPMKFDNYEYFIPAILFKNSSNLSLDSIGANMGLDYVWVRDTRAGTPMVMTRNKGTGNTFTLARITEKSYTGIDEYQAGWLVNKNLNYSSIGISNIDGYVSTDICYPGIEGSVNYLDKNSLYARRSHPVRDDVIHSYHISFTADNTPNYNDAVVKSFQSQYSKSTVPEVKTELNKVYDASLNLLSQYTREYITGKMGMAFGVKSNGDVYAVDYCMGFIGQQTSVGFQLIRDGYITKNSLMSQKGEGIIDFWVNDSFTSFGFPKVWFYTTVNTWAPPENCPSFIRYMSDGMEGILDAYLEEKANGTTKSEWLNKCVTYADWLVKNQNSDGSYYRAYDQDTGKVYEISDEKNATSKSNTTCPIRYLVRMYEQTNNKEYLDAAIRAGEYAYTEFYKKGKYYGGTPDGKNTIDKEAGVMALYSFNSLYTATGNKKWLTSAEHAAVFTASFIYTFDFNVWGKSNTNIYRNLVGTSGLSIISTGSTSTDAFSAYLYYEYFKLYIYTGNDFYYNFSKLLQNNTKQFINIDGSLPYAMDGLVMEAQSISNQYFYNSVDVCLAWCNIAMVDPIANMEDTFGVMSIQDAKNMGIVRLRILLDAYGSGGKKR